MRREYYSDTIPNFISSTSEEIFGSIAQSSDFSVETTQRDAWLEQIRILKNVLQPYKGSIYFEYSIPRMGKRIDVVLLVGSVIFVLEFKVGEKEFQFTQCISLSGRLLHAEGGPAAIGCPIDRA